MFRIEKDLSILQAIILSVLSDNDEDTAAEVIKYISSKLDDDHILHRGTIYPAIKKLDKRGLVDVDGNRPMKVKLSSEGKDLIPKLAKNLLGQMKTLFDLLDVFQSGLESNYEEIRVDFIEELIKTTETSLEIFKGSLEDAKDDLTEWKEVNVK